VEPPLRHLLRADLLRYCDPGGRYQDTEWSRRKVLVALANEQGAWAVIEYRLRHRAQTLARPTRTFASIACFVTRKLVEVLTGISIAGGARFGPGLFIGHFGGIVVGPRVTVGDNCNLSQGVTLGDHRGSPCVGDCVYFAPGAIAFGPITIGDHVAVGANAVVNEDVPTGSTVLAGRPEIRPDRPNMSPRATVRP
jgi:serine O-acetyltransferase